MPEASFQISALLVAQDRMSATTDRIAKSVGRLDKTFGTFMGRLKAGIQWSVLYSGIRMVERGIRGLLNVLPNAITAGREWAATVDDMADVTGMAAEQASTLAAVQKMLTGSTDGLASRMARFAKSVTENRKELHAMGVEIIYNRDGSVDAYQTFQSLRQSIAATGDTTRGTAAIMKVLGRGAIEMTDLLHLTDRQWRMLAASARDAGLVMSEASRNQAEMFERQRNIIDAQIQGIGTSIFSGLLPTLMRFADGFSKWLKQNMAAIVNFAVGAANTVLTVVSELLGIDMGQMTWIEQLDKAGKKSKDAKAGIHDYITALGKTAAADKGAADAAARHAEERARLARELHKAQAVLRAEQGDTGPLRSRSSGVDVVLWHQAHQARLKDARERVENARKLLREHSATMGRLADVTDITNKHIGDGFHKLFGPGGKIHSSVTKGLAKTLADTTKFGTSIADAIKDAIFGPEMITHIPGTPRPRLEGDAVTQREGGPTFIGARDVSTRSGGLIGSLSQLVDGFSQLSTFLGAGGSFTLSLVALGILVSGPVSLAFSTLALAISAGSGLVGLLGATGPLGLAIIGAAGAAVLAKAMFDDLGKVLAQPFGPNENKPGYHFEPVGHGGRWVKDNAPTENVPSDYAHGPRRDDPRNRTPRTPMSRADALAMVQGMYGGVLGVAPPRNTNPRPQPGPAPTATQSGAFWKDTAAFQTLSRANQVYLDVGSPLLRAQSDQQSTLDWIRSDTTSLNDTLSPWGPAITNLGTMVSKHDVLIGSLDKVDAAHDKLLNTQAGLISGAYSGISGLSGRIDGVNALDNVQNAILNATSGAVGGLSGRMAGVEAVNNVQGGVLNAQSGAIGWLSGRIDVVNALDNVQGGMLNAQAGAIGWLSGRIDVVNALDNVQNTQIGGAAGAITGLSDRIRTNRTDFDSYADFSRGVLGNLSDRIRTNRTDFDSYADFSRGVLGNHGNRLALGVKEDKWQDAHINRLDKAVFGSPAPHVPEFARGGRITGPGIVGERGPELLSANGTITSNDQIRRAVGGASSQPITVNIQLDYAASRDLLMGRSASTTTRTASA